MHVYMLIQPKSYKIKVIQAGLAHPDNRVWGPEYTHSIRLKLALALYHYSQILNKAALVVQFFCVRQLNASGNLTGNKPIRAMCQLTIARNYSHNCVQCCES